jgi:catechol 2,3-dioxygenase-like lactoylglutathione lyase family enzyme
LIKEITMQLHGLHHVTAVTGDAPGNLDFYTRVLGLRLVKKSVNQDDVSAYHLFYSDKLGTPGLDMTFFDWPQTGPTSAVQTASPRPIFAWTAAPRSITGPRASMS